MKSNVILLAITGVASAKSIGIVDSEFFVGALVFWAGIFLISLIMLVLACTIKRKPRYEVEKYPLLQTGTPLPVDIIVSNEYKTDLLCEVKSDEFLAWAYEPTIKIGDRRSADAFATAVLGSLMGAFFFVVFCFGSGIVWGYFSACCLVFWVFVFVNGTCRLNCSDVKLYAITNKRIFMLVITPKFRKGKEVIVHSSDYDGLQQISMERKEDGSGNISFSLTLAGANPIRKNSYANPYAFENIPNVTHVKNLIESFKSTHQKV